MSNMGRIRNRIIELMREEYVYESHELVSRIKPKYGFPESQVYATLSHMVDDDNEIVYDMLGRPGLLRNIKTLYFFQPLELKDNLNISMYDRTTPVNVKQNITVKIQEVDKADDLVEDPVENIDDIIRRRLFVGYDTLFDPLSKYNIARDKHMATQVHKNVGTALTTSNAFFNNSDKLGLDGFHKGLKYIKSAFDSMAVWGFDLSEQDKRRYVVDHLVDYLSIDDLISVITYYINHPVSSREPMEQEGRRAELNALVWNKLTKIRVSNDNGLVGFVLPDANLMIQDSLESNNVSDEMTYQLREAEQSEKIALSESINRLLIISPRGATGTDDVFDNLAESFKKKLVVSTTEDNKMGDVFGSLIGFITHPDMAFRTKNMLETAQKGSTCDAINHGSIVKRLNLLSDVMGLKFKTIALKEIDPTNPNIKHYSKKLKSVFVTGKTYRQAYDEMDTKTPGVVDDAGNDTHIVEINYVKTHLCVIMEMLLRYHDDIATENKRWFLSPVTAELNKELIVNKKH
jgi:hypothetical protein